VKHYLPLEHFATISYAFAFRDQIMDHRLQVDSFLGTRQKQKMSGVIAYFTQL
jgi:hypothetical protein